jgi:hypothetical protein
MEMNKDDLKKDFAKNRKSRQMAKSDRIPQRSSTEPKSGGMKGRKMIGNTGKVKLNSNPKCCSFCKPHLCISRANSLYARLLCYDN